MKKFTRLISFLTLCLTLTSSMTITTFAADSTITFNGSNTGFIFQPGSEYTESDLFGSFKDVMPGDTLAETITVTSKDSESDYVKVYMKAVVHDEEGNPLTYSETYENIDGKDQTGVSDQRDETVVTMADFLAQLTMRVYNGDELIYEASPDELDGLAEYVQLAILRSGESVLLTVELDVPIELGNEYANRVGEVDWVFLVEAFEPKTPESEDPKPEESKPGESQHESEESQPSKEPTITDGVKTGDDTNITPYVMLIFTAVIVLYVLVSIKRRTHQK